VFTQKRKKQLQTRGLKRIKASLSLSLSVCVFHNLIIFTLAASLYLVRTVMVSQFSVLRVCWFFTPFFSQVV